MNLLGWAIYVGEARISKEIQLKNDIFEKPLLTASLSAMFIRFFGLSQVLAVNGNVCIVVVHLSSFFVEIHI
jgi:hypothetical protein